MKRDQAGLHDSLIDFFATACANDFQGVAHTYWTPTDSGHGGVEVHRCWASVRLEGLPHRDHWAGRQSIAMVEAERHIDGWASVERSYFNAS